MLVKNNSSVQQLTNFGWYAISVMLGYSKKKLRLLDLTIVRRFTSENWWLTLREGVLE